MTTWLEEYNEISALYDDLKGRHLALMTELRSERERADRLDKQNKNLTALNARLQYRLDMEIEKLRAIRRANEPIFDPEGGE